MHRMWVSASVVLLVNFVACAANANLIQNGSFEESAGIIPPGTYSNVAAHSPYDWETGTGFLFHSPAPGGIAADGGIWPIAPDGAYYYDIGNQPASAISQQFEVTTSGEYLLRWLANTAYPVATSSPYGVTISDRNSPYSVSGFFNAYTAGTWVPSSLAATLSAGSYELTFVADGNTSGLDSLIDDISLVQIVPEPTTVGALLVGLIYVACRRRR